MPRLRLKTDFHASFSHSEMLQQPLSFREFGHFEQKPSAMRSRFSAIQDPEESFPPLKQPRHGCGLTPFSPIFRIFRQSPDKSEQNGRSKSRPLEGIIFFLKGLHDRERPFFAGRSPEFFRKHRTKKFSRSQKSVRFVGRKTIHFLKKDRS